LGHDLEEQFRARFTERHKAQLINDQEVLAGQLLLKALQPSLVLRLDQVMHQCGSRCEAHLQPLLTRSQPKSQSDVRLARA
jgi:hypothetical protein